MIHQHRQLKMAATVKLWPFDLRMANDDINEAPILQKKYGHSTLQIFSNLELKPNTKHWIPFGFPVYVLRAAL